MTEGLRLHIFIIFLLCFTVESLAQNPPQRPSDSDDEEVWDRYYQEKNERYIDNIDQILNTCRTHASRRADASSRTSCVPENYIPVDRRRDQILSFLSTGDRRRLAIAADACLRGAYYLQHFIQDDEGVINLGQARLHASIQLENLVLFSLADVVNRCRDKIATYCPSANFWQGYIGRRIRSEQRSAYPGNPGGESRYGPTIWDACGPEAITDCNCTDSVTGQIYQRFGRMQRSQCSGRLLSCEPIEDCFCRDSEGVIYQRFGRVPQSQCRTRRQTCRDPDPMITCECREDRGRGRLLRQWKTRRSQCITGSPC